MFSSSSPEVSAALNWKQPNCAWACLTSSHVSYRPTDPVFFSTHPPPSGTSTLDERQSLSIGEAVDFARSNNLLGIFADGNMLVRACRLPRSCVPDMISSRLVYPPSWKLYATRDSCSASMAGVAIMSQV